MNCCEQAHGVAARDAARNVWWEQERERERRNRDRAAILRVVELLRERGTYEYAVLVEHWFAKELTK